jgi:hypothetical protein
MTQALQNQPFAKLKPVVKCTAYYVRENEELKEENAYLKEEKRHLEKSLEMFKGQSKEKENEELRENWENLREWMKGKKINFSGDDRFWRGYEDFYYDVKAKLKELEEG